MVGAARAESLPEHYAAYGLLIVTQLVAAPFPHPARAEGHTYKDQFYSAKEHYSNSTVAIFIPKALPELGRADFVVHFHGWMNNVEGVLQRYKLIEQMAESGRRAVLVVPQGPRDAPDSFGGKLEDAGGFERFMTEVGSTLRSQAGWKEFVLGSIVLSAHSGGYEVAAASLDHGGLSGHVTEVWLFDALYAQTARFAAWFGQTNGRFIDIYTEHGGTKEQTERLMASLKQGGTNFLAGKEGQTDAADLIGHHLIFLYSLLPHNDVLDKHRTFLDLLNASGLRQLNDPEKRKSAQ